VSCFTLAFGQIPNGALLGTPPIFGALDLQPFRIGELGERALAAFWIAVS